MKTVKELNENIKEYTKPFILGNPEILEMTEDWGVMRVDVTEDLLNFHGIVHGGIYFALSDTVAGILSNIRGNKTVTVSSNINYLRSANCGQMEIVGEVLHRGRTTVVVEVKTYCEEKVLTIGTFTMMIIE